MNLTQLDAARLDVATANGGLQAAVFMLLLSRRLEDIQPTDWRALEEHYEQVKAAERKLTALILQPVGAA